MIDSEVQPSKSPYWVFGYGSLIWKPPPHAVEKRNGYVKGVLRRFAQSSNDHRGTPEAPGRVVTLIEAQDWHKLARTIPHPADEDFVWGVAYRIDPEKEDEVRANLIHREKNGFTIQHSPVYVIDPSTSKEVVVVDSADTFVGTVNNEAFVGYEPIPEIARIICARKGPSGPNRDYLYHLAESVRELFPTVKDDYLFELEAAVKALEAIDGKTA